MSMNSRLTSTLVATTVVLLAGCGSQLAGSDHSVASGQSSTTTVREKASQQPPARRYLTHRASQREGDYEGPQKPVAGRRPTWAFHVVLTGFNVDPGAASQSTVARVTLRGRSVCWRVGALPSGYEHSRAFGRVHQAVVPRQAAIRVGAKGKSGPVVVVFGARYRSEGCIVVAPVVVNAIASAPRFYYLNLLTTMRSRGAVRAQL